MPLISFGREAPLLSKIGEPGRRAPAATLPPPTATFLPEAVEAPSNPGTKRIAIIMIGVVVLIVLVVVIVLLAR